MTNWIENKKNFSPILILKIKVFGSETNKLHLIFWTIFFLEKPSSVSSGALPKLWDGESLQTPLTGSEGSAWRCFRTAAPRPEINGETSHNSLFRQLRGSNLIYVPKVRWQEPFLLVVVSAEQDLPQAALISIYRRENWGTEGSNPGWRSEPNLRNPTLVLSHWTTLC